jgi:TM2 domain-containing membrane protein YozV
MKNPGVAAVLSFLITGLGQIYNGNIGKGIVLFLIQIVNLALMSFIVGYITFFIVWVYGIIDAYKSADRINALKQPGASH